MKGSEIAEAKRTSARKMKGAGVMIDKKLRIPAVFQKAQPTSAPIARETAKARKVAENGPRANCSATSAARWVNTLAQEVLNSMSLLMAPVADGGSTSQPKRQPVIK